MEYKQYQKSRNAAWQILIDMKVDALPVRISEICKKMGIDVRLYTSTEEGNDGKSIVVDGRPVILVNDACNIQRQRFTAAHELGHIIAGDVGKYQLVNREPSANDNPIEQAANVFASRLLAPAIVLRDLNVHSAEDIERICNISHQAAEFRWERLQKLYDREREFLSARGRSCFGMHPLERQVQAQFADYIKENRL